MPALKPTTLPDGFLALKVERQAHNEHRDCTVIAIAAVTGKPYAECREALARAGRRSRRGCYPEQQEAALRELGFKVRTWTSSEMVEMCRSYPLKGIPGITTHHPRRFPKQWAQHAGRKLLFYSRGHVSAFVGGVVQDWAINRSKRVVRIKEVLPLD
jgi:hypothetical protein